MFDTQAIDERRESIAQTTPAKHKSQLGQFMTPSVIANFMASMFEPMEGKKIKLLDAGAGIGSLTAAFVSRAAQERVAAIECEACEIDVRLHSALSDTLDACRAMALSAGAAFHAQIQSDDFILSFSDLFARAQMAAPTHAILNPPYKKIHSASSHRMALRANGVETTNLYSAFVALALMSLAPGGELVAITPRSFCNGPYFKPFRELLLSRASLVRIHMFESRTHAFKGDDVLQENVIFHLIKGRLQGEVALSISSDATFSDLRSRRVPFGEVVATADREKIFCLATDEGTAFNSTRVAKYCNSLEDIGLTVSTGPVVDFRLRENWRQSRAADCVPLVYAHHFENGFIEHPKVHAKKPNFISLNDGTRKWLMPSGHYTIVRRLSSKEEKRRIVPAVFEPSATHGALIGFENHLNVFHSNKAGLDADVAKGLAVYLGSSFADQWLRRFSGHTQVNATDLRALRYPDIVTLRRWGQQVGLALPTQEEIDVLVDGVNVED